ncbi:MAG TPA: PKD domain-containing protein [Solirubrobacteraceae bacterium]
MRRLLLVAVCLALTAAPVTAASAKSFGGIIRDLPNARAHVPRPLAHVANLPYGGGPVLHSNRTHLIFWQPSGSGLTYDAGYQALVERFLRQVAADSHKTTNVYGLSGQYSDAQGPAAYASSYGGATVDSDQLPRSGCVEPPVTGPGWSVCLNDKQLQTEIEHVVHARHLPTKPGDVYFLVTPKGLGSCTTTSSTSCALGGSLSGYCGYHSQSSDGDVLYAVIPYNAVAGHCQSDNPRPNDSTADPAISTVSHEHAEMVTDPSGDAWIDGSGNEAADLCITSFGPAIGGSGVRAWNEAIHGGHYYLQELWSNADSSCEPRPKPDTVSFRAKRLNGRPWSVSFAARGFDPHGAFVSYLWFFGDGASGQGANVSHRYRHTGRYRVVVRATDSWRNWVFYAETLTVSGRGR